MSYFINDKKQGHSDLTLIQRAERRQKEKQREQTRKDMSELLLAHVAAAAAAAARCYRLGEVGPLRHQPYDVGRLAL